MLQLWNYYNATLKYDPTPVLLKVYWRNPMNNIVKLVKMSFYTYFMVEDFAPLEKPWVKQWISKAWVDIFVYFILSQRSWYTGMQKERWKVKLWNRLSYGGLLHFFDFSELAKSFRDWNLKIQHWTSVDLNGLKNGTLKHFLASN